MCFPTCKAVNRVEMGYEKQGMLMIFFVPTTDRCKAACIYSFSRLGWEQRTFKRLVLGSIRKYNELVISLMPRQFTGAQYKACWRLRSAN